ncbi:hypothetical protein [Fluoribacter gormanii]|uniref:Uncharacterized protein n=1 Tax=Fluoribacter gormanii TaxID=464 RepID=A0A377GKW6_9GAMM|nr:hypothetical protein [Fluoribacter gormanii]KTD01808.1 hypothetical protein Lgor_2185 [Fluoribacter gormanii]SIR21428.1 hypothetical protein SAMN05421777_10853 [Fluoribacter gormanii]STO25421.1 Uncharacterised protein [Fluoribacter gormanii]
MLKSNNYKFFIEVNTFKIHVQTILNRLRPQKDSNIVNAIKRIIEGKSHDSLLEEVITLDSLLNHPEQYIKNIDNETKKNIHEAIREILEVFIDELVDEAISSKSMPQI